MYGVFHALSVLFEVETLKAAIRKATPFWNPDWATTQDAAWEDKSNLYNEAAQFVPRLEKLMEIKKWVRQRVLFPRGQVGAGFWSQGVQRVEFGKGCESAFRKRTRRESEVVGDKVERTLLTC